MISPSPRRMKTYTAASGYVYQYYFVGQRDAHLNGEAATEFIFDVTRDRHATFAFSVFLTAAALISWSRTHGRALSEPERYASAKLRLLRGFDQLGPGDLRQEPRQFAISAELLDEMLAELGVA